ncbi:hypothetical protein F5Y18DRAFT_404613 [Xylariaceae sp. FL1019]|nr:hypothetical protein F5Y18DRAFT_404613 [Xylariaceae sp. FL1019]
MELSSPDLEPFLDLRDTSFPLQESKWPMTIMPLSTTIPAMYEGNLRDTMISGTNIQGSLGCNRRQLSGFLSIESPNTLQEYLTGPAVQPYFEQFVENYLSKVQIQDHPHLTVIFDEFDEMMQFTGMAVLSSTSCPCWTPIRHWICLARQLISSAQDPNPQCAWRTPRFTADPAFLHAEVYEIIKYLTQNWLTTHRSDVYWW